MKTHSTTINPYNTMLSIHSIARAFALISAVTFLSACGNMSISFGKKDDDEPVVQPVVIIPVEAAAPHRGNISSYFETTTRVEAERRVDVAAKNTGRCLSIFAQEGDSVEAGQILAELEKDEAQAAYVQSEVLVRQNQTSYELAKQQYEEGLGPKMEMDNALYTYQQSEATLESQRIQLENLTIRAPIDGIVTLRNLQEGMLVSVGAQVYSIMDPSSFMLAISPPEKELPRLKVGQKARVTIDSLRGREFDASIRRINPSVDPVSGTVKVVLDFDEDVGDALRESAFARVKLVMATLKNVLLVPREAVVEEDGRQFVYVARMVESPSTDADASVSSDVKADESGTKILTGEVEASEREGDDASVTASPEPTYSADRVEVRTGLDDSRYVQVYSGLEDSDMLITNGQHTLKSGTLVRLTNARDEIWSNSDLGADEALDAAKERRESGEEQSQQRQGGFGSHH